MAQVYQHQLQPFEENQSPSPTHEHPDPFNLSRSRSSSSRKSNHTADSPSSPINTLHRQLSGDPDAPPPAWKRRASFTQKSPGSTQDNSGTARSPSQTRPPKISPTGEVISSPVRSSQPPPSASARRHPGLQMTTTTRPPIPSGMYTHDPSPNASSTSLHDPTFAPPQPAFSRKRGEGGSRSNRSSIHSMDTSGMTSEDLWNLESSESVADLSNPQRSAMERPLDTIRRLSMRSEKGTPAVSPYSPSLLPVDFLWPVAPPEEEPPMQMRRMKSKSTTSVPGMAQRQSRLGRKKTSRQTSADPQMIGKMMDDTPPSDNMPRSDSVFISSAHSSATDLSKGMPVNKSMTSLGSRPPSAYYSRDFLSQLAPREGGYAIAAMLSSPPSSGQMSPEERRRSSNLEAARISRPPTSKSAGMGRWSLDGGEHYNRPYGSASANTTSSNLSAPPINSPDPSPPADENPQTAMLPEGASPAVNVRSDAVDAVPVPLVASSSAVPTNPSPLGQSVIEAPPTPALDTASIPVPPIPTSPTPTPAGPTLSPKKSKKQLAKEAKAQEKAEAAKILAARAAKAREELAKKQAEKEAAKKREKEEKERKKMEKKMNKKDGMKSASQPTPGSKTPVVAPVTAPSPANLADPSTSSTGTSNTAVSSSSSPNIGKQQPSTSIPLASGERRNVSMPAGTLLHPATSAVRGDQPKKTKLGLFGTIRKRFSTMDTSSKASLGKAGATRTPVQLDEPTKTAPVAAASAAVQTTPAEGTSLTQSQSTVPEGAVSAAGNNMAVRDQSPPPGSTASNQRSNIEAPIAAIGELSTPARQPAQPVAIRQSEDLPLRTSSVHHTSPSPSRTPQPPTSPNSQSSPSAGLRSRNSIQGPRPMPRSGSISSRTHSPPSKSVPVIPPQSAPSGSGESTGLSQVQSHLTSTSSSGTYDSQTPMTSEEDQDQRLGQGEKMGHENGGAGKREVAGLNLGRVVAAH